MDKNTITLIIALWGAFLSSVTFGWNLFRDLSRRGRLRVTCYIGQIVTPGVGIDPNNYIVWNVTNIGKEPVVLTHIGGSLPQKQEFMVTTQRPLPQTLQSGEYFLGYGNDLSVLARTKCLFAVDSLGRRFKAPKKQLQDMQRKYASGELSKSKR
jgi:hypothetical protein